MLADVGQTKIATATTEKLFTKNAFERLNLRADSRLRHMEFYGGFFIFYLHGDHREVT